MSTDPPIHADQYSEVLSPARFRQRLLLAGERLSVADNQLETMAFVEELFPVAAKVYHRAIGDYIERLERSGAGPDRVTQELAEARRILGLSLWPFSKQFLSPDRLGNDDRDEESPSDDEELERFRALARPWALAQLKSCTTYVLRLTVGDYSRGLRHGVLQADEQQRMRELSAIIEENESRIEAKKLVEACRQELTELAGIIGARVAMDPGTFRALSYVLECTGSDGLLEDLALGAVLLRGNRSPGAERLANPLQRLSVAEVGELLQLSREQVTGKVSKFRSNALDYTELDRSPYELDARHLWVTLSPPKQANDPASIEGKDK